MLLVALPAMPPRDSSKTKARLVPSRRRSPCAPPVCCAWFFLSMSSQITILTPLPSVKEAESCRIAVQTRCAGCSCVFERGLRSSGYSAGPSARHEPARSGAWREDLIRVRRRPQINARPERMEMSEKAWGEPSEVKRGVFSFPPPLYLDRGCSQAGFFCELFLLNVGKRRWDELRGFVMEMDRGSCISGASADVRQAPLLPKLPNFCTAFAGLSPLSSSRVTEAVQNTTVAANYKPPCVFL